MYKKYPFTLEQLPYAYNALEPVIDTMTMEIHHGKHHQAYVDNLNKALADKPELQDKTLAELMSSEMPVVKNNAGGVWNHDFFWKAMTLPNKSSMSEKMKSLLENSFGSVDEFMGKFEAAALSRFGSGWVWLILESGKLDIVSSANQDCPEVEGKKAVLALDVWEHAYYLKYQNKRGEYAKAWWQVVSWERVEELCFVAK